MENENLSPYQQAALAALQEFYQMSYDDALAEAKACTTPEKIAEMEKKIDAKYSMDSAIDGVCFTLGHKHIQLKVYSNAAKEGKEAIEEKKKSVFAFMYRKLIKAMEKEVEDYSKTAAEYGDADKDIPIYDEMFDVLPYNEDKDLIEYISEAVYGEKDISQFVKLLKELNLDENELVIDVLDHIHYKWIEKADKQGKFFDPKREKTRFQFSYSELIGFDELKKDLLFAKPILDRLGIEYTEEGIKEVYERKVREFMEGIESKEDLQMYIIDNAKRRLERKGPREENETRRLEAQTDPEVAMQITEQILENNPIIRDIIKEKENENKKEVKSMKKTSLWDKVRAFFVRENDKEESTKGNGEKTEIKKKSFREDIKHESSGNEPKSEEPRGNEREDDKALDSNSENNNDKIPEDEDRID